MQRKTVVVLLALLGALGCSKKSSDDPSVGEFGNALLAAMSSRMAECQGGTVDAARQSLLMRLHPELMAEAQDAGRIALDAERAQACLDWLPSASCAELRNVGGGITDCEAAFVPLVEEGGECTLFLDSETTAECVEGQCVADSELACVTHGTCVRFAKVGEVCGTGWWDRDCTKDAACVWDGELPRCAAVVTHTAVGDPCNDQLNRCAGELYCDGSVCQARIATDQPCSDWDSCVFGDHCNGTCLPYKSVDAACTPGNNECVMGAFCDTATLKCTAFSTVDGACGHDSGGEYRGCIDSWCDSPTVTASLVGIALPTGTCRAYKAEGEACTPPSLPKGGGSRSDECGPTGTCDSATSTCMRFLCSGDL